MTKWHIAFLIFGLCVVAVQVYRLLRWGGKLTRLKRRQEIVFLIWYSLLIVNVLLPRSSDGWEFLLAVLVAVSMVGLVGYWSFLYRRHARDGRE